MAKRKGKPPGEKRAAKVRKRATKKKDEARHEQAQFIARGEIGPDGIPDRRALEGMMFGRLGGTGDTPQDRAQELAYEAFNEPSPRKRAKLAQQALSASPDCADAYVVLAEQAPSLKEAVHLYEEGVKAGERALGQDFQNFEGEFWGWHETRPYMRARLGLANALWDDRRQDEAVAHYQAMLRLNPDDNQGVRWLLLTRLLELGRDDEAQKLLDQFPDDFYPAFPYGRALLQFRREGDTDAARTRLAEAVAENPHVPAYLTGETRFPAAQPPFFSPGSEEEAMIYAAEALAAWRATPGAIPWLRKTADTPPPPDEAPEPPRKASAGDVKQTKALPQDLDEAWVVHVRHMPEQRNPDALPWTALVVDAADGRPLGMDFFDDDPDADALFEALLFVMHNPQAGDPRRPGDVFAVERGRVSKLRTRLKKVGVACARHDMADEVQEAMDRILDESLGPAQLDRRDPADIPQQSEVVWQADIRPLDLWLPGEGEPARPWMIVVTSVTDDKILATQVALEQPTADDLWTSLEQAMRDMRFEGPHRPGTVQVRSHDLRIALQPRLDALDIACEVREELDHIDPALGQLAEQLGPQSVLPALSDGIDPPQVGAFFEAAAEFYRQKPWRKIASDAVVEITPEDRPDGPYYAVVMGQSGMVNGLAVYFDADTLRAMFHGPPASEAENIARTSGMSVLYGEPFELAFADLEAIDQFGWPVAAPEAYPTAVRLTAGQAPHTPNADELALLEALLRAIPQFAGGKQDSARLTVPTAAGQRTLKLTRMEL